MKTGLIITAFTNTPEKEEVLYQLLFSLRKQLKDEYYIILATHSIVPINIQNFCDAIVYEKDNQIDKRKYSHGAAECNLISRAFSILEDLGIEYTHKLTYDMRLDDISIFKEWESKDKKLVIAKWDKWGISALAFYCNIYFFRQQLKLFKTVEEMFKYSDDNKLTYADGTVLLETIWGLNIMKNAGWGQCYIYPDPVEMMLGNMYCDQYQSKEFYI